MLYLGDNLLLVVAHERKRSKTAVNACIFHVFPDFVHRYRWAEVAPCQIKLAETRQNMLHCRVGMLKSAVTGIRGAMLKHLFEYGITEHLIKLGTKQCAVVVVEAEAVFRVAVRCFGFDTEYVIISELAMVSEKRFASSGES